MSAKWTITRIWKEIRALAPWFAMIVVAGLAAIVIVDFFPRARLPGKPPEGLVFFGNVDYFLDGVRAFYNQIFLYLGICQAAIIALAAAALFGSEFSCGSIGRLLAQPIGRNRIWLEKTSVILILVLLAVLIDCALCQRMAAYIARVETFRPPESHVSITAVQTFLRKGVMRFICRMLLIGMMTAATAPTVSLWLRQTHTTFWATLVLPFVVLCAVLGGVVLLDWLPGHFGTPILHWLMLVPEWSRDQLQLPNGLWQITSPVLVWSAILYPIGWWKFRRLEV